MKNTERAYSQNVHHLGPQNDRRWLENWIGTRVCIGITFAVAKSDEQKYRQPDRKCTDAKDDTRQKTLADFPWKV